jgi:hypothetical protein
MSDRDHIAELKPAADPVRVAAALGLRGIWGDLDLGDVHKIINRFLSLSEDLKLQSFRG